MQLAGGTRVPASLLALIFTAAILRAQPPCANTPAYSTCEFAFELTPAEAAAHPDPYRDVDIQAEFRSPRFKTFLLPAVWDGGNRFFLRFSPTEDGQWVYKVTSNLKRLDGQQGAFTAAASEAPGFVRAANVHHWQWENKQPHLWLADVADRLGFLSSAEFDAKLAQTVQNKFTHLRVSVLGGAADRSHVFSAGKPKPEYFDELARRLKAVNQKGIVVDLVLAATPADFIALLPEPEARERFLRFAVGSFAALNVTWEGLGEFEATGGRALLKEIGLTLKKTDPYGHPRSTNARITSAPLLGDGWMTFIIERNLTPGDDETAQIEHQLYPVPFVGLTTAQRLWDATTDGQYPMFEGKDQFEAKTWFDFVSDSRHWELEPYYDVDGGRTLALVGVEYIVYVDHPGPPIEVEVENHGYDVTWLNPLTGESLPQKKKYKGEHFTGQPPDNSHPWVLRISREGRKESMLKSYKFESQPLLMQEIETDAEKLVYQITAPVEDPLTAEKAVHYGVKLTKRSRGTRTMLYLWTGEVVADGEGFRVLGNGAEGELRAPAEIVKNYPAVFVVRVYGLNANGKVYEADKVFQLAK
jgi:hypothetical protein